MKRTAKDVQHKKWIALGRQRNDLWKQYIRGIGYEDFPKPVHYGWVRTYELRDDVAKRKDAHYLQRILDVINVAHHSFDKEFKDKVRYIIPRTYDVVGFIANRDIAPHRLNKGAYEKLFTGENAIPTRYQSDFITVTETSHWGGQQHTFYIYKPTWHFKVVVKKHMLTRIRLYDSEMESRLYELENYVEKHNLIHKMYPSYVNHHSRQKDKAKLRNLNSVIQRETDEEIDDQLTYRYYDVDEYEVHMCQLEDFMISIQQFLGNHETVRVKKTKL